MNCKPGDLAYIVRSEIQANVGAVVEVLSINIELSNAMGEPFWNAQACRPLETMFGGFREIGTIEDSRLRPISGVPVHDEEHDEVTA
ncbi:hypothetical protein R6138_04352 [Ralstonia thomasii]|uniref:hypothetical protein n=1 Tax=Ralstonia thomasii TaxID=3058596 RepID=UPI0028F5C1E7|nr:hypothetical protein [Ralstonia sp. LMG 18095]CAJ0899602.1 hypothetical protein R6138_04352 [Ralstonia sp. LMG 18095]